MNGSEKTTKSQLKVAFIQKVRFVFQIAKSLKEIYFKLLSWAWNLNLLFNVIGGKFKQVQDSDLEIWKTLHTFWKKSTFSLLPKFGRLL